MFNTDSNSHRPVDNLLTPKYAGLTFTAVLHPLRTRTTKTKKELRTRRVHRPEGALLALDNAQALTKLPVRSERTSRSWCISSFKESGMPFLDAVVISWAWLRLDVGALQAERH